MSEPDKGPRLLSEKFGGSATIARDATMADKIPFTYGDFYDVPRMIRFQFDGTWYFLRSEFDEEKDEHTDFYDVYRLPFHTEEEIKATPYCWTNLGNNAHIGRIPIAEVGLDETRRRSVDAGAFKQWLLARVKQKPVDLPHG